MRIIHTADLHLGQILYQNYGRTDEHAYFFDQLETWCRRYSPDALVVSGDLYDIQQPSATTRREFNERFARLHRACPSMKIVITAGNHDSASRIAADSPLWELAGVKAAGIGPTGESDADLFIERLPNGYIVAIPYLTSERTAVLQSILDHIAAENTEGLPVVMTAHQAVAGLDATGHDFEVGKIKTQSLESFGTGFDYLALGHIHKPQTLGRQQDCYNESAVYDTPVARYAGSALHVSCDETFPHSVSLVEIDRHGGRVTVTQLLIDQLRRFTTLPSDASAFADADEAIDAIRRFAGEGGRGYFRLRLDAAAQLPSDFSQRVYDLIESLGGDLRYNPRIIWQGDAAADVTATRPRFEVAELQQITDPLTFIEKTADQYPGLDLEMVREAFDEVRDEVRRIAEDEKQKNERSRKA